MGRTTWTTEQDCRLRELEEQGLSGYLIGIRLGKTRNAVIGRSYRLRGYRRRAKAPTMKKIPIKTPRRTSAQIVCVEAARPVPVDDGRRLISLLDLTEDTCRWPFGDRGSYLFCGAPRAGPSPPYCAEHARLHYR